MSTYALTPAARAVLAEISSIGGGGSIVLHRHATTIACQLGVDCEGPTLSAHVEFGGTVNSLMLQTEDGANAQHIAEWIEAIANGTLDTALATSQRTAILPLLPCCKCDSEAVAYDYAGPGSVFLNGVRCRHGDCQSLEGAETPAMAREAWNELQLETLEEQPSASADMVNHPPHYTGHPSGVECIEVSEHLPFCLGNAFKYLFRRDAKGNPLENIEKAIWYVNRHNETYPEKPNLPTDAREALGLIVVHEPHPIAAAMLIIAGEEQCGAYDACVEMLKAEAERLRWIAQHAGAAA